MRLGQPKANLSSKAMTATQCINLPFEDAADSPQPRIATTELFND